ncbi:MAG TPA: hypothetical protein DCZ95_18240 [Verrucomicrobia bacterium]|nr:hypothetical protein [Verrucomicrobiota bacterium]
MKAGALRHILVFQTKTETSDGMGPGGAESWADTLTARAERWHISGAERVEAARTKQNSMVRWHCRHNAAIVPTMRIKWVNAGVTHYQEILAVNPLDQQNREIEILAEEKI